MSGKLQVLQRGTDMVLAEHYTSVHHGRLTAATLETVTFDRPHKIGFRLVRGPVPCITEDFTLADDNGTTRLEYSGELGTDFGLAGQRWANRVAAAWEAAVRSSFRSIRTEAERRVTPGPFLSRLLLPPAGETIARASPQKNAVSRNECFIRAHIYARSGILAHALSTLPAIAAEPFRSFWQEIRSPNTCSCLRAFLPGFQRAEQLAMVTR
jgi:hypothetical protein